uniref:Uncharacterized protein n=1 Tax=Anopheles dirus TaxID=7168 RepID=A0A182NRC4_9DIPT
MMRMICIDMPYLISTLVECRAVLRRNQMPLIRLEVIVPDMYNVVTIEYRLHYKFKTYRPFLIDGLMEACEYMRNPKLDVINDYAYTVLKAMAPSMMVPCPHGNRTYKVVTEFKEEYAPKSIPAGEYRLDVRFATEANLTLIHMQLFFAARRKGIIGSIMFKTCVTEMEYDSSDRKNESRSFNLQIKRLLCVDTPYTLTEVIECRSILRRNKPPLLRVEVYVPDVYNFVTIEFKLFYKFRAYLPLLIDGKIEICDYMRGLGRNPINNYAYKILNDIVPNVMVPCPQGNRTYKAVAEFKEEYAPRSIPAVVFRSRKTEKLSPFDEWRNSSRSYELSMNRLLCIDTPYTETELLECRAVLRRNQMPLLRVALRLPKMYNIIKVQFKLHYKHRTFVPFLIDGEFEICEYLRNPSTDPIKDYIYKVLKDMMPHLVHPCPHGNKTYETVSVFKPEYAPKSVPAGDYRMDVRFATASNLTMLSMQGYFSARRKGIMTSMLEW